MDAVRNGNCIPASETGSKGIWDLAGGRKRDGVNDGGGSCSVHLMGGEREPEHSGGPGEGGQNGEDGDEEEEEGGA